MAGPPPGSSSSGNGRGSPGQFGTSMPDAVFERLATYIYDTCGLKLTLAKKILLEGRIRKRLRVLELRTFAEYCDYLFSHRGQSDEVSQLIDVVTTHKTDFFREPRHFEHLVQEYLPRLFRDHELPARSLRVWSAACSTGEEPYTIAMVLADYAARVRDFRFSILATDVSEQVLQVARNGIYEEEKIQPIPAMLRKRYLLRSKDPARRVVRIVPELREAITFRQVNLMEPFQVARPMDVIFCRNVLIYFDRPSQEKLVGRFYDALAPGGHLFVGHSETLNGFRVPFSYAAATVYERPRRDDE